MKPILSLILTIFISPLFAADKPNVIFLITDDQLRKQYGYLEGKALTPNIDKLAKEGAILSRGYASTSVCTPSRYTALTGRFASRCEDPFFDKDTTEEGMVRVRWNVHMHANAPNLPKILQNNGYKTAMFGKWHLGIPKWEPAFDQLTPKPGSDPRDPEVKAKMQKIQTLLREKLKVCGFDVVDRAHAGNLHDDKWLVNTGCAHHNPEWVTEGALDFLESMKGKNQPFYMYFSTTLMHSPGAMESLRHADPRISGEGWLDKAPEKIQPSRASVIERTEALNLEDDLVAATWLDDSIGALISKLEELGMRENTLIVYTDDHGMENQGKGTCYEGGIKAPMLINWPKKIKAQVCDELIQNTDFVPTILDACGIEKPTDYKIDGRSILPVLSGKKPSDWRKSVYSEIGFSRAVTTKKWKYLAFRLPKSMELPLEERLEQQAIFLKKHPHFKADPEARINHLALTPGGGHMIRGQFGRKPPYMANYFDPDQLYDLENDPNETTNLAKDPAHAEKLAEMKELLKEYLNDLPGTFEDLKPIVKN